MKRIFTLCFLIPNFYLGLLFTEQFGAHTLMAQEQALYPKIQSFLTPSPQAAALTRYGDYPVNFNTGLVDLRVPLYTVKSGSLSLPMDISFHASGRMANETNGVLGMRWVLNAGGVVTRTVRGYPDEWNYLKPYTVNPNQTPSYDELRRSCTEGFIPWENDNPNYDRSDSELDIFSYVLPSGKSGKFVLKIENGVKKAMQIPYEALKIELVQDNSYYGYYGAVNITDVDGTIYYYGDGSLRTSNYFESNKSNPVEEMDGSIPTGWYLKRIVSADKKDVIEFDYQNVTVTKFESQEVITTADRIRDYSVWDVFDPSDAYGPYLIEDYLFGLPIEHTYGSIGLMTVPALTSIRFKDGVLNFNYAGQSIVDKTTLQNIVLTGAVNKKIKFNQQLDPNENFIRYLKDLEILSISDGIEKTEEKYGFDYYKPYAISPTSPLALSSDQKDWWGYYGGSNGLVPFRSVDFIRMEGSYVHVVNRNIGSNVSRDPNLESMKLGMLKSIAYPTGGKTEFEYETNYYKKRYSYETSIKEGPGLRIKKVTNKPIIGKEMVRSYKYGENEDKAGYINSALEPGQNTVQESSMMSIWDFMGYSSGGGGTEIPLKEQCGYRIRKYSSDPLIDPADFGGNIIWYDMVTEYSEEDISYNGAYYNEGTNGKIIYVYSPKYFDTKNFVVTDREYYIDFPKVFADYSLHSGGKLLSKTTYKKDNGIFVRTLNESYDYSESNFGEVWDMPTYRHVNFSVDVSETRPNGHAVAQYDIEKDYHSNNCSVYGYGFRKYVSSSEKLYRKIVEHFDGAGISFTSEYNYEPQYDQLRKEEITGSDGKKVSLEYEYPFDKISSTSPNVYNKMVDLNILASPVSKSQYVEGVFKQGKRTEFYEPSTYVIRPQKEYFKKDTNSEELIITYDKYDDRGNPMEVSKVDGTPIVYIWGYDKTQPIAKIENATYSAGKSNSISAHQQSLIDDAVTATVNETTAITENNLIAKLKLLSDGFRDAMVTTYTYDPLIGITSITDPKGYTIYYEYDEFNRLKDVKDAQGNILSENQYNYKQ